MQSRDLQLSAFTCLPPENVDARLAPVKLFPVRKGLSIRVPRMAQF
jgi:hypothetical protein